MGSGAATSGKAGVEGARGLRPNLVLMDLTMPGIGGLEATRRIKAAANPPHVVALTLHEGAAYRAAAATAGADGFVTKSRLATDLLPVIETLCPRHAWHEAEVGPDGHRAREHADG